MIISFHLAFTIQTKIREQRMIWNLHSVFVFFEIYSSRRQFQQTRWWRTRWRGSDSETGWEADNQSTKPPDDAAKTSKSEVWGCETVCDWTWRRVAVSDADAQLGHWRSQRREKKRKVKSPERTGQINWPSAATFKCRRWRSTFSGDKISRR